MVELNSWREEREVGAGKWGLVRSSCPLGFGVQRRPSTSFMGVRGPLYAWLVRGIPLFVALGSMMLSKQFQPYRYQGYGEATGNPALSAPKDPFLNLNDASHR